VSSPLTARLLIIFDMKSNIMNAISYVTNEKGERTALLIDISELKQEGKTQEDVNALIEDLEYILAIELSKKENDYSSWEEATAEPRKGWDKAFKKMHENGDDKLLMGDVFEDENFE
jgi:hypothetical protein